MFADGAKNRSEEFSEANKLTFCRLRGRDLIFDVITGQAHPVSNGFHGD